ncbi:MAG: sigma-54 dependent transcriptional regulator [Spirochaetia bacterium]|nr:sigma-54 dependent transcriptional regulator [Spirochaetia bacterium]MCE1210247.1 sigma-54 dependent transcriptional regulator [Spirochaetia bacterium]
MTATGSLRKDPLPENLAPLFAMQRTLMMQSEVPAAIPICVQIIAKEFPDSEVLACFSEDQREAMRIVAASPDFLKEEYASRQIRLGTYPCGLALEQEEPVSISIPGKGYCIEAPILQNQRIAGALSLLLAVPPAGRFGQEKSKQQPKGQSAPNSERGKAEDLIRWSSFLIEEALGLRSALLGRIDRHEERIIAKGQADSFPAQRPAKSEGIAFHAMIGSSDVMKNVFRLIAQVANTDATVLLSGESGTGKELAARAIHQCSSRAAGPFVAVNCAALPESLIESELFGHEKGAFTGAVASRQGRFEAARDGSLFLDEIGDLSPAVQVKLLRILQEHSFERVGGNKSIRTNARIIVATHRDLQKEVREGRFREDLFFRLNVFPIRLPPLRERGADILLLADHFAETLGISQGKTIKRISSPALDLLMIYHWPGNVRELENCIARAIILSSDSVIHSYDLPPSLQSASSTGTEPASSFDGAIARLEKEMLVEALKIELGNSAQAARRLGITERRFRFALQRYKIDYRQFRTKM